MYFTDLTLGQRTRVAQLRYGRQVIPSGAAGFVEDWWQTGMSCLDTEERSAYFHNIKHKQGNNAFTTVTQASGTAVYNQWHNEVCANYQFVAEDGKFLWSSGGDSRVVAPLNVGSQSRHTVSF
jgi:hypothetical protein